MKRTLKIGHQLLSIFIVLIRLRNSKPDESKYWRQAHGNFFKYRKKEKINSIEFIQFEIIQFLLRLIDHSYYNKINLVARAPFFRIRKTVKDQVDKRDLIMLLNYSYYLKSCFSWENASIKNTKKSSFIYVHYGDCMDNPFMLNRTSHLFYNMFFI